MRFERKRLTELKAAPYNPRHISEEALDGLKFSLSRFGIVEPIIWNERTGYIVGGHQRHRSLIEMGEKEVAVVVVDLSEEDEKALNVTLNNYEAQGTWNEFIHDLLDAYEEEESTLYESLRFDALKDSLKQKQVSVKPDTVCPCCNHEWNVSDRDMETRNARA